MDNPTLERRLKAKDKLIAELEAENKKVVSAAESGIAKAWKRVEILETINAVMLEALRKIYLGTSEDFTLNLADEAIRKAKGHCPDCDGTGKHLAENKTYHYTCASCNGKGE